MKVHDRQFLSFDHLEVIYFCAREVDQALWTGCNKSGSTSLFRLLQPVLLPEASAPVAIDEGGVAAAGGHLTIAWHLHQVPASSKDVPRRLEDPGMPSQAARVVICQLLFLMVELQFAIL